MLRRRRIWRTPDTRSATSHFWSVGPLRSGVGDACSADTDGDGLPNAADNCPADWIFRKISLTVVLGRGPHTRRSSTISDERGRSRPSSLENRAPSMPRSGPSGTPSRTARADCSAPGSIPPSIPRSSASSPHCFTPTRPSASHRTNVRRCRHANAGFGVAGSPGISRSLSCVSMTPSPHSSERCWRRNGTCARAA